MARNDITPWQQQEIFGAPNGASANFVEGEPVIYSSGTVVEAGDDPASVAGIAAGRSTDVDGTVIAAGTLIPVYRTKPEATFRCKNFATLGDGTAATPTQANAIGVQAGLTLASGTWSVDTGTANTILEIIDVEDDEGRSITNPNDNPGTGTTVVFRFL